MLCDRHNRIITYLRISVTDRCNFRCVYCMPAEGVDLVPKRDLLSFEEIERVARVGARLGLRKIRLTGGEPTVRKELPSLVAMLSAIDGINEIAITTNAARLAALAQPLKDAGLQRVNISLDTLSRERMAQIARRDHYDDVMAGIASAIEVGLTPLKFNAVVIRGVNDDELCDLLAFAQVHSAEMRFIEYMPMGIARSDEHNKLVTAAEMRQRLAEQFDLEPLPYNGTADPARGWRCRRTGAHVGFITSMSENFCSTCNRMRLTAEGGLRPCLHQNTEVNVRALLREGGSDVDIEAAFREAATLKWVGHHMNDIIPLFSTKEMVAIGG